MHLNLFYKIQDDLYQQNYQRKQAVTLPVCLIHYIPMDHASSLFKCRLHRSLSLLSFYVIFGLSLHVYLPSLHSVYLHIQLSLCFKI